MSNRSVRAGAVLSLASLLCAWPSYMVLDALRVAPVELRDHPWPLELGAMGLAVIALVVLRPGKPTWIRLMPLGALGFALTLSANIRGTRFALPPSTAELPVGQDLASLSLISDRGTRVTLPDAAHEATLLVFFRGAS